MKHFERLEDGRIALSQTAMLHLEGIMTHAAYNPFKTPLSTAEEKILELLEVYERDGFSVMRLT